MVGVEPTPWKIVLSRQAIKDLKKVDKSAFKIKVDELFKLLQSNPFQEPPYFETLIGDLKGTYSRRINIQHRLVYEVCEDSQTIKILSLWTHYDKK